MALGIVGPSARACGVERDVRFDFPAGIFRFAQVPVSTWMTGDVFARAYVRWLEIQRSMAFIREQLAAFPEGPVRASVGPMKPEHFVATLVEGWRGEICHVALTDEHGCFSRYKIVDPSFHNWIGSGHVAARPADFGFSRCATRVSICRIVGMICRLGWQLSVVGCQLFYSFPGFA